MVVLECMLNGRNYVHNDFTSRDVSVVDYTIVPYEQLSLHQQFEVIGARKLCESAGFMATEPRLIPDHNMLLWSLDISQISRSHTNSNQQKRSVNITKYNMTDVPADLLDNRDTIDKLNDCIKRLQETECQQNQLNEIYNDFCQTVKRQMDDKLDPRSIKITIGLSHMHLMYTV